MQIAYERRETEILFPRNVRARSTSEWGIVGNCLGQLPRTNILFLGAVLKYGYKYYFHNSLFVKLCFIYNLPENQNLKVQNGSQDYYFISEMN